MGDRPFSFYPPVVGVEHNEWLYKQATWSEILVTNTKTNMEVWVPRRFLGELSKVDEPVMIVAPSTAVSPATASTDLASDVRWRFVAFSCSARRARSRNSVNMSFAA